MIYVYGSGILAYATAGCLARWHKPVTLVKSTSDVPDEPGLSELTTIATAEPTSDDTLWLAFDTPVDDTANADIAQILDACTDALTDVPDSTLVVLSSQVPVGFTRRLHLSWPELSLVCAPENLRHGHAVADFLGPARIVLGSADGHPCERITQLYDDALLSRFMWMSYESAEMSKHGLNAFLATSIAFANELAAVCTFAGADYEDVLRALRTDPRIGRQAYLKAGPANGSHLLRDIRYLLDIQPDASLLADTLKSTAWHS